MNVALSWQAYAVIVAYAVLAATISFRAPALGLAFWIGAYPLFVNLIVPPGLEQLPPTRLGTILVFLALLSRVSLASMKPVLGLLVAYGGFLLVGLLSSLLSPMGMKGVARTLSYAEPMLWLCLGLWATRGGTIRTSKTVLMGVVVGLCCVLLFAIPEFVLQKNPLLILGLSRTDGDYMFDVRLGFTGRLVSTLGQPVYAGLYGVIAVACAVLLAHQTEGPKQRTLLWAIALLGVVFVFFTGTRAAIVGLCLLLLAFVVMSGQRRILKFVTLASVCALGLIYILPRTVSDYWIDSISLEEPGSSNANVLGRIALTKAMFDVFQTHALLGIGPGFFQKSEGGQFGYSTEGLTGVENQYATLLAENGAVGTVLFMAWLAWLIVALAKARPGWWDGRGFTGGRWAACVLGSLAVMAVTCFVLTTVPMFQAMCVAGTALGLSRKVGSQAQ